MRRGYGYKWHTTQQPRDTDDTVIIADSLEGLQESFNQFALKVKNLNVEETKWMIIAKENNSVRSKRTTNRTCRQLNEKLYKKFLQERVLHDNDNSVV